MSVFAKDVKLWIEFTFCHAPIVVPEACLYSTVLSVEGPIGNKHLDGQKAILVL